ncbi:MAG: glycosyltransferase [Chloroflexi bacterium]|jgi:glycosyltransferase involved in cell wall biosynthesis|nr:glycosyltransferase [Chloroflexota bacterium]MBT5319265.1 glycosyltransferase [Chloroflexota bacterium]
MNENGLLVSIVTPTFNSAEFVQDHLNSVKSQSYANIEHVFVDGASVDGTVDLIKEYAKNRNVKWVSEPDSGTSEAVTKGLKMATGDIIVMLPSDDLMFSWSVQTAVNFLSSHPDVDIVHGDWIAWDVSRRTWNLRLNMPFSRGFMGRTQTLPVQVTYFRKKVLDDVGHVDPKYKHANDLDFLLRATDGRKVKLVREILGVFTKRPGAVNMQEGAAEAVEAEVSELQARYLKSSGPTLKLLKLWDRVQSAAYRRVLLARMLFASSRSGDDPSKTNKNAPWPGFLNTYRVSSGSAGGFLRTLLPFRRAYELQILRKSVRDDVWNPRPPRDDA